MGKNSCNAGWKALKNHYRQIEPLHMRDLFNDNPCRFDDFSIRFEGLLFDFSKNRILDQTLQLLIELAREAQLGEQIEAMFSGQKINTTENRAVLHTALRNRSNQSIFVDGHDVMPGVKRVRNQMRRFSEVVRSGSLKGSSGKSFKHIVNIGIGGSDLGPRMALAALEPFADPDLTHWFVSSLDGTQIHHTLNKLDPQTTLFIVVSKSFTTSETMINARTAKQWLEQQLGDPQAVAKHFVAVSANRAAAEGFGIVPDNLFELWDWVGGRYSLWSAVGLSLAIAIGMDRFEQMLDGAYAMDCHFRTTAWRENIPVIMALIGIWYANFFNAESYAIIPYDHNLRLLPSYLQQVDMESNGKGVTKLGEPVDYSTGPIIWGQVGSHGQHAFFQLLHQGTHIVPRDFLCGVQSPHDHQEHRRLLLANFLAQGEALMRGKTAEEVRQELQAGGMDAEEIKRRISHQQFTGNRPSNSIIYHSLTPRVFGQLLAMYEHRIFVQGVIWGLNSFDQWGVELGKQLAGVLARELTDDRMVDSHDSSTRGLEMQIKQWRQEHLTAS
ncbi:MAG: glucose-6-phosphate isomerase [Desulfuromonas sp.]|nr:glucose-6-phosphate isomerase [Desulfuromonas sp.]